MNDFKVNDKVERLKPQTITAVTREGYLEIDYENEYHHCPDEFKLSPPKPVYPNPPHKHVDVICHVANGGVARNTVCGTLITLVSDSGWKVQSTYEIVQPKTEDELRIDELQYFIKLNEDTINEYKRELAELKPTVHY